MKNLPIKLIGLAFQAMMLLCIISCGDDDDTPPAPTFAAPQISVTSPADGVEVELGQTLDVSLSVSAEAGLSSVSADNQSIQTYGGTETSDAVTYQISPTTVGTFTVDFMVVDAQDSSASTTFSYVAVEPPVPPFIISDLGGAMISSEVIEVESWDMRTTITFANSSDLSSTQMAIQFVADNGEAMAGVANPASGETNQVMQIIPHAQNWGAHYVYGMIKLGETIPVAELQELPQLEFNATVDFDDDGTPDASTASVADGFTRVIQIDAYYDDTIVDSVSMNAIKQLPAIYGLDLSKGYQVDLILAKDDPHGTVGTGEIQGMYSAYSAWITEANTWQTLTFEVASEGQSQFLDDGDGPNPEESRNPATISEVDVVTLVPAFSQTVYTYDTDNQIRNAIDGDYNHLYFRNLRIVNADN